MAVQAQLCREKMGVPLPMCGLQDWMVNPAPAAAPFQAGSSLQDVPFHPQQNAQNLVPMAVSQPIDAQLEIQRQEIDCFLQLRNERLRYVLREQRKQQQTILLKSMESKALYLMKRKEEELARATKKKMELEACLRKLEMESESWQRLAKANEAKVMDLNKRLEQVRESLIWVSSSAEDEESIYYGSCDRDEEERDNNIQEEDSKKKMACKHCNTRSSYVLFLPCRHLCSCNSCEAFLVACPVCGSVKEASIKVYWV
ncbi:hypothetical protein ES332_A01G129500v1 [Gossypium tomentosum]|uniref:RING-type domain-containing protein n=1 Tax=Gossypium tomentosum TaxID=34277 RepID=A0A5D2RQY1_GOSTO|nr:hypothetical protein ES332_A01G129500v1 [Gossypium tomentosum]